MDMSKNKKIAFIKIISCCAICVAFGLSGFFWGYFSGRSNKYEEVKTVEISSFDQLKELERDTVLNDRYILVSDLTVSGSLTVGSADHPFDGTFDGNGHTITYSGATSSLFGYTSENSCITRLTVRGAIASNDVVVSGIASVNRGEISVCKTEGLNITLSEGARYAGGVSAVNYGAVSYCMSDVSFSGGNDMHVSAGGIAAYNRGQISTSVVSVSYSGFAQTDIENNYEGSVSNQSVGAVCGVDMGKIEKCGAEETEYYLTDSRSDGVGFLSEEQLYNPTYIFQSMGFSYSDWSYDNGSYNIVGGGVQ